MFKKTALLAAGLGLTIATGSAGAAPVIYEGFGMDPGGLGGSTPSGTGLTGNWGSSGVSVVSNSLSFGILETSGNHALGTGSNYSRGFADPGSSLINAGLMADGAELWFSALAVSLKPTGSSPNSTARTYIAIGNGSADGFDRVGANTGGRGFEIKLNAGNVQAFGWAGPGAFGGPGVAIDDGTHLVVGKITWGAFGVTDDTLEVFLPDENLNMGAAVSTTTRDFDQLGIQNTADAFDTISFAGGHLANAIPEVDEIRFGATYADVTPAIPEPSSLALLGLGGLLAARRRRA